MTAHHPNFPPSLAITPHVGRLAFTHRTEDDPFGTEAQRAAISTYGIAGRVWEAAHALCAYVDPHDAAVYDPPFTEDLRAPLRVVELGSGTGVVAACIADVMRRHRRADEGAGEGGCVVATDLPDVCPLLQRNLGADGTACVRVRPLAWGNPAHVDAIANELASCGGAHRATHIVCSDLVYFPQLFGPLLRTLLHLTRLPVSGPAIQIVMADTVRSLSKEAPFWSAFGLWFAFRPVVVVHTGSRASPDSDGLDASRPWRQVGAHPDTERTFLFVAHRRPESTAWPVPETDHALMAGVGAHDTSAHKGDDTFETILFLSMEIDGTGDET